MHRVVVTGIGAIGPIGHNAEDTWQNVIAGKSGVGPITLFDTTDFTVHIAAEIKDFDPGDFLDRREVRRQDRFEWIANIAANEAIADSGLEVTDENSHRIGVAISSGVGGIETFIDQVITLHEEGPRRISPFAIPRLMTNGGSGTVSIAHGMRGPSFCVTSACASSSDGIGIAAHLLRAGIADVFVTGGSEAGITPLGIAAFDRIGAYTSRTDNTPAPFSADRDGLVMGEGAAVLILETLAHAQARGANILAELIGYGSSADAYHITAPTEDGSGSAAAIQMAIKDAGIDPSDLDYINAHGTGTELNDSAETKAVKLALGEAAYNVPMSSTKSMTGHMMGSTGALEAMFCIQAIRDNVVPPTINFGAVDPECDLDYIPNEAREIPVEIAMSNSFGFGGHNAVLIFKSHES
jgi:3-oxoacyl-[acyl-carrier-protein] synthase II